MPEYGVCLEALSEEEADNFIDDFEIRYIISVLGEPVYLYSEESADIRCPDCGNEMTYVAAIGSDYGHILKSFDFEFGEQILYYFYCRHCKIIKVIGQST